MHPLHHRIRYSTLLCLAVAVVGSGAGRAQSAGSAGPSRLTAMDHAQIRQLAARATFAMDTGADNGFTYAALFTADGESVRPNSSRTRSRL